LWPNIKISAINSCWEKCDEKYLGWTEGQTDRGKTVYPPSGGAMISHGQIHVWKRYTGNIWKKNLTV
jgi:hypothetical protein